MAPSTSPRPSEQVPLPWPPRGHRGDPFRAGPPSMAATRPPRRPLSSRSPFHGRHSATEASPVDPFPPPWPQLQRDTRAGATARRRETVDHRPRAKGAEGSRPRRLVRPGSARSTERLRREPGADLPPLTPRFALGSGGGLRGLPGLPPGALAAPYDPRSPWRATEAFAPLRVAPAPPRRLRRPSPRGRPHRRINYARANSRSVRTAASMSARAARCSAPSRIAEAALTAGSP
jgi:hypothetical protein